MGIKVHLTTFSLTIKISIICVVISNTVFFNVLCYNSWVATNVYSQFVFLLWKCIENEICIWNLSNKINYNVNAALFFVLKILITIVIHQCQCHGI